MICLRVRSIHDFSIFLQLFLQKAYKRLSNNKIWGVTSTLPFIYISNVQLSSIICLCILSIFICSKSIFFKITELWQFLPLKNLNLLPRDIFQDIFDPSSWISSHNNSLFLLLTLTQKTNLCLSKNQIYC